MFTEHILYAKQCQGQDAHAQVAHGGVGEAEMQVADDRAAGNCEGRETSEPGPRVMSVPGRGVAWASDPDGRDPDEYS